MLNLDAQAARRAALWAPKKTRRANAHAPLTDRPRKSAILISHLDQKSGSQKIGGANQTPAFATVETKTSFAGRVYCLEAAIGKPNAGNAKAFEN